MGSAAVLVAVCVLREPRFGIFKASLKGVVCVKEEKLPAKSTY